METNTKAVEKTQKGTIEIYGVKPTVELLLYVSGLVDRWIEREQSLMFLPKSSNYLVHIERQSYSRNFLCYLQVGIGSHKWQHQSSEVSVTDAVKAAVKGLNSFHATPVLPPDKLFEHRSHGAEFPQYCDPENNAFLHAQKAFMAA